MGERNYLRDDVREALEEILADRTPTMNTEAVRALARAEAESVGNEAQMACETTGPICSVRKEIEAMRTDVRNLQLEQTKMMAVIAFHKWSLPILVTIAVFIAGVIIPRVWPVHAQPQAVQQVQGK